MKQIMKRRAFLTKAAAAVGALCSTRLMAQMNHEGHMKDMATNTEHSMPMMQGMMHNEADLLPITALPTHQPLPTLSRLKNVSDQANVFKATLTAKSVTVAFAEGLKTEMWAYNDQVPGPAIVAYEGDRIEITLQNDLPQATTIHWHGLPVPPDQDGNPQDPVESGKSKTYQFTLPIGSAGTYWYHPHGHETVAEQVFRGLAGAFIVKPKEDNLAHIPTQEWLISDLKLSKNGDIAPNSMMDWMNGREGQFVLINGAHQPHIVLNAATRVRVWNACSGRYLKLSLAGADLYLIGTDGGLIEQPHQFETLLLSPAERAEILIVPKKTGNTNLEALAYDRGKMGNPAPEVTRTLAMIEMTTSTLPKLPEKLRTLPVLGKTVATKTLEYTETMEMGKGMTLFINGKVHDMDRIDLVSKVGDVEEWHIFNNSHMDHNFHIHGTLFFVLEHELEGKKTAPSIIGLKDTVNLKPYERVRVKMVQNHKGLRMYHCHVLEHETLGMMGQLNVI